LDWTEAIAQLIELETFSSVWYWAVVVVSWAVACHWLIGIPFDMLIRARRGKGREMADLEAMVDINVRRIVWFQEIGGAGFAALAAFFLAGTGLLAIGYRFELAVGVLILAVPLFVVLLLNLRLARALNANPLKGQELVARLFRVRLWTQGIAAVSLFATSAFGIAYAIESMNFL
jgi:hypothetical protein